MKRFISRRYKGNDYPKFLIFLISIVIGNIAYCQDKSDTLTSTVVLTPMTPNYSDEDIEAFKWDIIIHGDTISYDNCRLGMWVRSNGVKSGLFYKEFLQYALIMAFVYEFPPACIDVHNLLHNYRKKILGEELTDEELVLCIRSVSIGASKGNTYCKDLELQLTHELLSRKEK